MQRHLVLAALALALPLVAGAQAATTFTSTLTLGSSGAQVLALQQALNQDPDTRVALTGPGSPGQETSYFGAKTQAAVIRYQEKYAGDILTPAGLVNGNGRVGAYTRAKLNARGAVLSSTFGTTASSTTATSTDPIAVYRVKASEKVDIYIGDKIIEGSKKAFMKSVGTSLSAYVASVRATGTSTPMKSPVLSAAFAPSVVIGIPSPRYAAVGAYIAINGTGISADSVLYFDNDYIVRTLTKNSMGAYNFIVPSLPSGRYDIAVKTGGVISNTQPFVITDPKRPQVHLTSISPATVPYGERVTLTGSGFTANNNTVIINSKRIDGITSSDSKTLEVALPTGSLMSASQPNQPSGMKVPMSAYVINDNGFSEIQSFMISI